MPLVFDKRASGSLVSFCLTLLPTRKVILMSRVSLVMGMLLEGALFEIIQDKV